jgi:hypothetical protein
VLGDLAESGATGGEALRDILGLVARRQAALWSGWRSWVTLVGIIVPLGMLLSLLARPASSESAAYTWLYVNNWDSSLLGNRGFWYILAESAKQLFRQYITLACSSWTVGFLLGRISRRTLWTNTVLFCAMLTFGALVGAPRYFEYCDHYIRRVFPLLFAPRTHTSVPPFGAPSAAMRFYSVMFPLIVQTLAVGIPALWGMSQGMRMRMVRFLPRILLWSAVIASLIAMLFHAPGLLLFLGAPRSPGIWNSWQMRLVSVLMRWLTVAVYWPILYLVITALRQRLRHQKIVFTN